MAAGKKVWLTWVPSGEGAPEATEALTALSKAGLAITGSRWDNEQLEKANWSELATQLSQKEAADVWVVALREVDLAEEKHRYALSLLTTTLRAARAKDLHMCLVGLDFVPQAENLPTILKGLKLIDGRGNWAAKIVVTAHGKPKPPEQEFRLTVLAHPYIGQWFEVGPVSGEWPGAMVGIAGGGEISQHAVGKRAELPERTVIEYALEGLKAQVGEDEFTAFAVKNTITTEQSYFVRVGGYPEKILIGGYPGSDQEEAWILQLK